MSLTRRRRLEALERRRSAERPWFDPFDALMRVWHEFAAVVTANEHGPHPEPSPAFEAAMKAADRTAARLAAERR
jgi:hypothetical protein